MDAPVLDAGDVHHLERVVRLRAGQSVTVSDGAGRWRACRWAGAGRLEPAGEVRTWPRPAPPIGVGFALVKGERGDAVVQKLTEAGADALVAFVAERSVVRWDADVATRRVARWRVVAREAAMQSRRVWLPEVHDVAASLAAAVAVLGPRVALADPGGAPLSLATPSVVVGPEGGWSPAEAASGLPLVCLGATVLRADTAAPAAAVLLGALRAGVVLSPPARAR